VSKGTYVLLDNILFFLVFVYYVLIKILNATKYSSKNNHIGSQFWLLVGEGSPGMPSSLPQHSKSILCVLAFSTPTFFLSLLCKMRQIRKSPLRNTAAQVAHPSWPMMHANSMQPLPQQLDSISPSNLTMALIPSNDFSKGNNHMLGHASKVQDLDEDQSHPANDGPRKRGRKRKTVPADVKEAKRKELLERNRVAANRCRQKRKEWINTLENNRVTLRQDNTVKQMEKQLEWQINTWREQLSQLGFGDEKISQVC
jgi:hypothetical protein